MGLSNNPPIILELDDEMASFIDKNCDSNIQMGLNMLTKVQEGELSDKAAPAIVDLMENFKRLKKMLESARRERL